MNLPCSFIAYLLISSHPKSHIRENVPTQFPQCQDLFTRARSKATAAEPTDHRRKSPTWLLLVPSTVPLTCQSALGLLTAGIAILLLIYSFQW